MQRYPHMIELFPFFISNKMISSKAIKKIASLSSKYKAIEWVPISAYSSRFMTCAVFHPLHFYANYLYSKLH